VAARTFIRLTGSRIAALVFSLMTGSAQRAFAARLWRGVLANAFSSGLVTVDRARQLVSPVGDSAGAGLRSA
jgi:hypothetical protein